jgi:hypothetical protein
MRPRSRAPTLERMSDASPYPAQLVQALRAALDGIDGDLARMPFFVRPMARRGFTGRTGLDQEGWRQLAGALERDVAGGASAADVRQRHPELRARLEALAENFRAAPERAQKGMGSAPPGLVEASREREQAVRALLAWIG